MASHAQLLRVHCRLCDNASAIPDDRTPRHKSKLQKVILDALKINVSEEDDAIYPPFVCRACELKLQRFKKSRKVKAVNIQVPNYAPHDSNCRYCHEVDNVNSYELIVNDCETIAKEHGMCKSQQGDKTLFVKLHEKDVNTVNVIKCVTVYKDLDWHVSAVGKELPAGILKSVPRKLDVESAKELVETVGKLQICAGNPDYVALISTKQTRSSYIDCTSSVEYNKEIFDSTVRHKKCKLLTSNVKGQCEVCQIYRSELQTMKQRKTASPKKTHVQSRSKLSSLSRKALVNRARNLTKERRILQRSKTALQKHIRNLFDRESIEVSDEQAKVIKQSANELDSLLKPNSPQKLLWEQQKQLLQKKDKRSMRWHPAILRWCIAIQSKSASAYSVLRESGLLTLPHPSTLRQYTNYAAPRIGIQYEVIDTMITEMDLTAEFKRNVTLVVDEMKIKSGLVFSGSTGKLVGFTDVGDINNELKDFECHVKKQMGDRIDEELASHACTLMVRGIFTSVKQPVAFFPTHSLDSTEIYDMVWKTILTLENRGLLVRAVVADGALPNRKFFKTCASVPGGNNNVPHFSPHPLDKQRKVYFICDVPHLLKTTRNNLENSGYGRKTRNLKFQGKDIRWTHLLELYEWDLQQGSKSPGLRMLHKISYDHLHLTPSLRMRVKLAAQVLSKSVANAMVVANKREMEGTRRFIQIFDTFFDCLNVSNTTAGSRKKNAALAPYESHDDWRFEWLQTTFLQYISDWEEEVSKVPNLSPVERDRRCISKETREGLKITVASFIDLSRELLAVPGVKFILSEKFSQDPIEEYFSKQRGVGGASDNPSVLQFAHNVLALQVAGSSVKAAKSGNVSHLDGLGTDACDLSLPLPKRQKKSGH